uniref:Ephrin-A3b n=1 Tax=Neogobius melanostomus TaxID=47308 RepID=A0A8C6U031_9GOBI
PMLHLMCVVFLRREGYTMQVNVNDYLDIYCPHYNDSTRMVGTSEQYVLYMVSYRGYRTCDPQLGFKRWECNRPHAPHAPIKFSEKFQRYSAFSLGYEFNVGQEYYYISTPTHHHGRSCLRLRVYVCCSTASDARDEPEPTEADYTLRPGLKIDDIGESHNCHEIAEAWLTSSNKQRNNNSTFYCPRNSMIVREMPDVDSLLINKTTCNYIYNMYYGFDTKVCGRG